MSKQLRRALEWSGQLRSAMRLLAAQVLALWMSRKNRKSGEKELAAREGIAWNLVETGCYEGAATIMFS